MTKRATKYFYERELKPQWFLIDAEGKIAGRLASRVASLLIGKSLPCYTPNNVPPIFVVVVNVGKLQFTGKKMKDKIYFSHSGRPGGLKKRSLGELFREDPAVLFVRIVSKMLPKNKLRTRQLAHLKVFAGSEHPYWEQEPVPIES